MARQVNCVASSPSVGAGMTEGGRESPSPASRNLVSTTLSSHDSRYQLCKIEDVKYCEELFGSQLLSRRGSPFLGDMADISQEGLSSRNRRGNKEVEYVLKKLLTNVTMGTADTEFDVSYWSLSRPLYTDQPARSLYISRLLLPQDISVSHKTGKVTIASRPPPHQQSGLSTHPRLSPRRPTVTLAVPHHDHEDVHAPQSPMSARTNSNDSPVEFDGTKPIISTIQKPEKTRLIHLKQGVSELLLNCCGNLLADVEDEILLIRDELYHRIQMFVLQEGLQNGRVIIDDDQLISSQQVHPSGPGLGQQQGPSGRERSSHRPQPLSARDIPASRQTPRTTPSQTLSDRLAPKQQSLTDAPLSPSSGGGVLHVLTGIQSGLYTDDNERNQYPSIDLAAAVQVVEHLGIKSASVFKRYRTSLLIQRLRIALRLKNIVKIVEVLQEVRVLKNSDCFDSLAITEVDNIFTYISNLNIRKSIYKVFNRKPKDSAVTIKYSILQILRLYQRPYAVLGVSPFDGAQSKSQFLKTPQSDIDEAPPSKDFESTRFNLASGGAHLDLLSSAPTTHSRKLFNLCRACVDLEDAVGRSAVSRIQTYRRNLQDAWDDLDLQYYMEEYEEGFKHVHVFVKDLLQKYEDVGNAPITVEAPASTLSSPWASPATKSTQARGDSRSHADSPLESLDTALDTFDFILLFSIIVSMIERLMAEALGNYVSLESLQLIQTMTSRVQDACIDAVGLWEKMRMLRDGVSCDTPHNRGASDTATSSHAYGCPHEVVSYNILICAILSKVVTDEEYVVPITAPSNDHRNNMNSTAPSKFGMSNTGSPPRTMRGATWNPSTPPPTVLVGYALTDTSAALLEAMLVFTRHVFAGFQSSLGATSSDHSVTRIPSYTRPQEPPQVMSPAPHKSVGVMPSKVIRMRTPVGLPSASTHVSIMSSVDDRIMTDSTPNTATKRLCEALGRLKPTDASLLVISGDFLRQVTSFLSRSSPSLQRGILLNLKQSIRQQSLLQRSPLLNHAVKCLTS